MARIVLATGSPSSGRFGADAPPTSAFTRSVRYVQPSSAAVERKEEEVMLTWALIFFIVAIIAAVLGFSGLAAGAAGIAQILFWAFLAIALVIGITHLVRGGAAT